MEPRASHHARRRADAYAFDVSSSNSANSGTRTAGIVSPQASIAYSPTTSTELYVSGGFGFHSNDARGTTITHRPVFAFVRFDCLF
jgi:hypothetical protein